MLITDNRAGFYTIPDPNTPVEDATTGVLLPSVEAKIIDEDGNLLARNKKGNVYTRTPFVMKGYLKDPVNTAQTITEDGWIRTGDIGWVDEEGKFYIVGRRKVWPLRIVLYDITANRIRTSSKSKAAMSQQPRLRRRYCGIKR